MEWASRSHLIDMKSIIPTLSRSKPQEHPAVARLVELRRLVFAVSQRRWQSLLWAPLRWLNSPFAAGDLGPDQTFTSTRHNLRWLWWDGVFAQVSESVVVAYLSLFVLALGATRAQIGLMSALSSLGAALVLLPGASIVEHRGQRKKICLLGGGGAARVALLLLALTPLAFSGPIAVYIAIALAVARTAFANLTVPAWVSLIADIVPLSERGRYFSSRNMAMGIAGMTATFLVGQLITRAGSPIGYQLAMGLAFAVGIASTFSFARLQEPPVPTLEQATGSGSRLPFLSHLRSQPDFLIFCATAGLWSFSLNIAGPFFYVYLVEDLKASANVVGTLSVISTLAALPGQRLFGILSDRWGPRRVQLVTGLLIPLIPWTWALTRSPWHVVPIELGAGFLWAGYGLASFNSLLLLTPEDRRPRYTALYQIVVMAALAGGAAFGSIVATRWGYATTFVLSGTGRLCAALVFALFVRVRVPPSSGGLSTPSGKV